MNFPLACTLLAAIVRFAFAQNDCQFTFYLIKDEYFKRDRLVQEVRIFQDNNCLLTDFSYIAVECRNMLSPFDYSPSYCNTSSFIFFQKKADVLMNVDTTAVLNKMARIVASTYMNPTLVYSKEFAIQVMCSSSE